MKLGALYLLLFLSLGSTAQLNVGTTVDPSDKSMVAHFFIKQPYGLLALGQKIGGGFSITNVFFKGDAGIAVGISTDTIATIGAVYNIKTKCGVFQPYVKYNTSRIANYGIRSDIPITNRITLLTFAGYESKIYSRFGLLYKFE